MKKVFCDRCGAEIGISIELQSIATGTRDLCSGCAGDLIRFVQGRAILPVSVTTKKQDDEAMAYTD